MASDDEELKSSESITHTHDIKIKRGTQRRWWPEHISKLDLKPASKQFTGKYFEFIENKQSEYKGRDGDWNQLIFCL